MNTESPSKTRQRKSMGLSSLKSAINAVTYIEDIYSAFRKMCEYYECENIPSPVNIDEEKKCAHSDDNPCKMYFGVKKVEGVTELEKIFFKNSDIESTIILSLKCWLEPYKFVSTLKFEYCNLTEDHIELLADILTTHGFIKELSLNGNPLEEQNHHMVLHNTQLFSLSLKLCGIDTQGVRSIAQELSTPTGNSLLHLNLASNNIFDEGIIYVVQFLRINRNLLSLNLADNKLRSKDCTALAQPLQKFKLDQDDILLRREIKFRFHKQNIEFQIINSSRESKNSTKHAKKISRERLSQSLSAGGIAMGNSSCSSIPELPYHPFVQDSDEEINEIYCKGNDNLTNLNLSYNRITKEGIRRILDMLNYQRNNYANDRGISRISIEGNVFDANACCDEIEKLLSRKHSIVSKQSNSHNSIKRNSSFT